MCNVLVVSTLLTDFTDKIQKQNLAAEGKDSLLIHTSLLLHQVSILKGTFAPGVYSRCFSLFFATEI